MSKRAKLDGEGDLRRIVLGRLPVEKPAYQAKLAAMATPDMLVRYYNWSSRLVPAQRREVLRSKEMATNPAYIRYRADIDRLLAKIRVGIDIAPHLSTQVGIGYEEDKQGRPGKRSLDLLLNDWGVHHLHFGHALRPDGFVERPRDKSELLFVMFRPGAAYVLGVFTHEDWTHEDIVRIAVRNWRDHNLFPRVNGVAGLERPITPEDRRGLRNAHVNALIELDGEVFMGRGGLSAAGTSIEATMKADRLLETLRAYATDEAMIVAHMQEQPDNMGKRVPARPEFEVIEALSDHGYGFALREKKSKATLWVG